ncbi:MAG: hypothetical protein AAF078_08005, partial [Planctomycetota bacterium]
ALAVFPFGELLDGHGYERRGYVITGETTAAGALVALVAAAPATIGTLVRRDSSARVREDRRNPDIYRGSIEWQDPNTPQRPGERPPEVPVGSTQISFDVPSPRIQVTHSLQTLSINQSTWFAASPYVMPDLGNAINKTPDGTIRGVTVPQGGQPLNIRRGLASTGFTEDYYCDAADLRLQTNDAEFQGFAAGEVLFLGFGGTKRGPDLELDFRFLVSRDRTDVTLGTGINEIEIASVPGWAYLWVYSDVFEDSASNTITTRPVAAMVERVFEPGDFSVLGLE